MPDLELIIMLLGPGSDLYFLNLNGHLLLSRSLSLLALLIFKLAVVQQTADRGSGGRGHLYQVIATLLGQFQRLSSRNNTQPLSVLRDEKNFSGPDPIVYAEFPDYARLPRFRMNRTPFCSGLL